MINMKIVILILLFQWISGETSLSSIEILDKINDIKYSYETTVHEEDAEFTFKIENTSYPCQQLDIKHYLFSVTYINTEAHGDQTGIDSLPCDNNPYDGTLKIEGIEEHDNDFMVCVIFLSNNGTNPITSSRFCHVVSPSGSCDLTPHESTFSNQHVIILVGFVCVILLGTILFTCIRAYIYRPRSAEEILATLSEYHANDLTNLAPVADTRRRRTTAPQLEHMREGSVAEIDFDRRFSSYHRFSTSHRFSSFQGQDNQALETLDEQD